MNFVVDFLFTLFFICVRLTCFVCWNFVNIVLSCNSGVLLTSF